MALKNWMGEDVSRTFPLLGILAGGIAFFFLLSLVPFLVVILGLAAYLSPVDLTPQVIAILEDLMPRQDFLNVRSIVETADQAGGKGLISLTFVFALWTTSNFMGSLTQGLHLIFSTGEQKPKSGLKVRLYSFVMVLIWGVFLALTAFLFLVAPIIESALTNSFDWPAFQAFLLKAFRFGFLTLMFVFAFGASYRLNARKSIPTRLCFQGGLITTVGWLGSGWAFTYWLPAIWERSVAFGALGSVVGTMIWAYACAWIVFIGALYIRIRCK